VRPDAPPVQDRHEEKPSRTLADLVKDLNDTVQSINTSISFSIDSDTKKTVIRVSDLQSGKVIRQIPPEDMLRIAARLNELVGLVYDKTR
jgi:flagellar protein FlaG